MKTYIAHQCDKCRILLVLTVAFPYLNALAQCPAAGSVIITEILYDSDGADAGNEWIELYNATSSAIDLDAWVIEDAASNSHQIDNSGPLIIYPDSYLLLSRGDFVCGGPMADYTGINIALNNTGDAVMLKCGGAVIDQVDYSLAGFPDPAGSSIALMEGRYDAGENDLGENWCASGLICGAIDMGTPGGPNDCYPCDLTADLIISEIHYNPCEAQGSDEDFEFIELFNRGGTTVDIGGWHISDLDASLDYFLPDDYMIEAGEYLVLANNATSYSASGANVLEWNAGNSAVLDNGGDHLFLTDCSGQLRADFSYSNADGTGSGSSNWPDCADGRCASLSLLDPGLTGSALYGDSNWGPGDYSAGTFYGSPGFPNQTGCCLIVANEGIECDGEQNTWSASLSFADGGDDIYWLSAGSGTLTGDDPTNATAGEIRVEDIPVAVDITLEVGSAFGCDLHIPFTGPANCLDCDIQIAPVPDCTNENAELYALDIYVNAINPPSDQFELRIEDSLIGIYHYSESPILLEGLDGDPAQTGLSVEVIDAASEPQLTITGINWDQSCGCSSCGDPGFDEYVEITNTGLPVDLEGYVIRDDYSLLFGGYRHIIPGGTLLGTGESIQLAVSTFSGMSCPVFDNSGDIAVLEDPGGLQVSALAYNESSSNPAVQSPAGPTSYCQAATTYDEPCDPLPIRWLEFSGKETEEGYIELQWSWADGISNAQFIIERSGSALKFESIGKTPLHEQTSSHSFIDRNPIDGRAYYRIVCEEWGALNYSDIISLETSALRSLKIYPTIVTNRLTVDGVRDELTIVSISGMPIKTMKIEKGGKCVLDVTSLESGLYFIKSGNDSRRFIRL